MSDRFLPAGLMTYAVRPMATLRFYATARGAKQDGSLPTAAEYWQALAAMGFGRDLLLWTAGTARPGDWPAESAELVPPLSPGETVIRGEGTWPRAAMPTAITLASGPTVQFWAVWEHSDGQPAVAASGQALATRSKIPLGVALVALLAAGVHAARRVRR